MDLISHALVGKAFQVSSTAKKLRERVAIVIAAFAPDLPVLLVYLMLGRERGRAWWWPENADWNGVRAAHPVWAAMWEVPHSFLFVALVVIPFVSQLRLPKVTIASYCSHIVLDLPTHTGEWGVKPFYPFDFMVEGITDVWAWPVQYMMMIWLILGGLVLPLAARFRRHRETPGSTAA